MASLASTRELHSAFAFHVTIDGWEGAKFSKISALETNVSTFTYREAGSNLLIKDPDQVDFPNVTLETGASNSVFFYAWANSIVRCVVGNSAGLPVAVDKRNVTVYQYNRQRKPIRKIQLYGAFPTQFVAGEWDNAEDKIVIERLTLAFDFFDIDSVPSNALLEPTQF